MHIRKVTMSRMRERYSQTVLAFRITYVKTDIFDLTHTVPLFTHRHGITTRRLDSSNKAVRTSDLALLFPRPRRILKSLNTESDGDSVAQVM